MGNVGWIGTSFNEHRKTPAATAGVIIHSIISYYIKREQNIDKFISIFQSSFYIQIGRCP